MRACGCGPEYVCAYVCEREQVGGGDRDIALEKLLAYLCVHVCACACARETDKQEILLEISTVPSCAYVRMCMSDGKRGTISCKTFWWWMCACVLIFVLQSKAREFGDLCMYVLILFT